MFLIFYLICGIGASLVIELTIPFSASQFAKSSYALSTGLSHTQLITGYQEEYSAIGASGAIMGIMAAFAYLFPNTKMYVMLIPIAVKAKYVIPVFILYDLFGGINQVAGDNIGHFAHLGGALVGFIFILVWNKKNRKPFY